MKGASGQDTTYTTMPKRRIVERFTGVTGGREDYPEQLIRLECGHVDTWRGQKGFVRCFQCWQLGQKK